MNEAARPYQDPSLPVPRRVEDLLARMTVQDKAGQLFHQMTTIGPLDVGLHGWPSLRELIDRRMTHFNVLGSLGAREMAEWHNEVQRYAAATPLGIPVTLSTDPRHGFSNNPAASLMAGSFSQWPEVLGLAAIGSEEVVERFAEIARQEYVAVGLRTSLHPTVDLTTEPRWARQLTTFGEDADLTARLVAAYIHGFHGPRFGPGSVSTMTKHFPGGGPQKDGEDAHFSYGREQVYPAGQFEYHLSPFIAAIAAGTRQMMPYYGMPVGTELEPVGFAFNQQVLTGILRERLGFEGIICSDWGVIHRAFWGVEELTPQERIVKAVEAGVDQFGGESEPELLVELVTAGTISESRIDRSVRALLAEKFTLGLFDEAEVDVERAVVVVGNDDFRQAGLEAQRAAHTLLTNRNTQLPLSRGIRVYLEGMSAEALADHAEVVDTPEEADVAIVRVTAPWEPRGDLSGDIEAFLEALFRAGSLDFTTDERDHLLDLCHRVPTVIDVFLERPAILTPLVDEAAAIIANFGATDQALVDVLFGTAEPKGRLPFDLPRSMAAVRASRPDAPHDTANPLFATGHGLNY